jgi:aspartyl-tRNA(Asn)/glutamyl-tRNA(Gln) amidotransferase subunit A
MLKGAAQLGVHPEIGQALEATGATLKQMGATLVEVALPDLQPLYATAEIIVKSEAASMHRDWLQTRPQDYGAHVRARIEAGLAITATQYIDALRLRAILARDFIASVFGTCDVMLLPTIPMPVPTIAETDVERRGGEEILAVVSQITRFTRPLSLIGLPVVTAPCGFSQKGLPIGFQFAGRPFQEARLMEVVDAFQQVTRFHLTPPSIAAPLASAS